MKKRREKFLQAKKSSPTFVGFFVSRHLGLLLCNIAIMKRFLPLLMFTCLLFGQDEEIIYSTLVDTNYEHGTFEFTPAVYKFTMEGSNIENVIPAFSYIKDISEAVSYTHLTLPTNREV